MENHILIIGLLLVALGMAIIILSGNENMKFSVVGVIGFIPFGFSNDKRLLLVSLIISVLLVLAMIALTKLPPTFK